MYVYDVPASSITSAVKTHGLTAGRHRCARWCNGSDAVGACGAALAATALEARLAVVDLNQSIKDPHKATHTRAEEKPHHSATSGVANPASQSDTGLGGCESQL